MQSAQSVVAEMEIEKLRQIAEHVGVSKLRDLVLLQVQLYQLREIAEKERIEGSSTEGPFPRG